ncbi:MAG: PilT/PilU family type 4a pilus ATPase [Armatimonadota bacterium]
MLDINGLLSRMAELNAADLFLKPPCPPTYKVSGQTVPLEGHPAVSAEEMEALLPHVLRPRDQKIFQERNQADLSYVLPDGSRFRCNAYRQRGTAAMVFRRINPTVPTADELNLPEILKEISMHQNGLILVTGATGSGKSTTLAAMIDWRNRNSRGHIVTLEDPIEFIHPDLGCVVSQREVGVDVDSFEDGLKAALRQAPNVILMGEIRDAEGCEAALHLCETGHLVFGTLHSTNAMQSIERVLQMFPPERSQEMFALLSGNLRGIVSQRLIRNLQGRYSMVCEILTATPRVRELIKRGEYQSLKPVMEAGGKDGMQTFDQSIYNTYQAGAFDEEIALRYADSPNDLKLRMRGFVSAS